MNRSIFLFLSIVLMCSFPGAIHSQSLSGKIRDSQTGQGIPFATVVLSDSSHNFVEGSSSGKEGDYTLRVQQGTYFLKVEFIGYESYTQKIEIRSEQKLDIELSAQIFSLEEQTIEGQRTTIEQFIDKKVITVGNDLLSVGGDANTVLEQLAEVQVDPGGGISFRGSSNVNVLVNGKPSPLSNAELLQQIPSHEIESIEIITSPSAKYQADGLTGIINIITHKKVKRGINGSLIAGGNSLKGSNFGTNFSYGSKKFNFRLGSTYRKNISRHENYRIRSGIGPFEQWNNFLFDGDVWGINASMDWFANEHNEFTLGLNFTDNRHELRNEGDIIQAEDTLFQTSLAQHIHKILNLNANYRHYFESKDHYLEIDAQASDNSNILSASFKPNLEIGDNFSDNDVAISNLAVDYGKKIGSSSKFEAGYLWNKQNLNNRRLFYNALDEIVGQDQFQNQESTHALYLISTVSLNKLTIKAGLRGELFKREVSFSSNAPQLKNDYANLFPSIHLSYKINKQLTLVGGYNRRTSRPRMYQVNPIRIQSNEFTVDQGNPDLRPEFSNNFDVSFILQSKNFRISPTISYRQKQDLIIQNNNINEEGVTVYSFFNNGKSDVFGIGLDLSATFAKWWNSTLGFNGNYEA
ncbi:MAG: TonB-dependent receptor, partial [Bacteroidota bacterium]